MGTRHVVHYAVLPLLAMGGCAHVGRLASTDLTYAATTAAQNGDPQGAACWTALIPVADTAETEPTPGLASVIEADRLLAFATEGPSAPCNAVGEMILSVVLRNAAPLLP
jgi:hypothetical protein